jgi:hypothetical protein
MSGNSLSGEKPCTSVGFVDISKKVHTTFVPLRNRNRASRQTSMLTDAPPTGVAVLSFEVTINSATLQPGNVALVSTPTRLEITKLETENAVLNTTGVAPGTYTGITVGFSLMARCSRAGRGPALIS